MFRSLGIRVEPSAIHWAAVEGTKSQPILVAADNAGAPVTYSEAQSLSWYRNRMLHIIQRYKPQIVAVRYPEPTGRAGGSDAMRRRVRIEGVVLEAADFSGLPVTTGALVTISANLGVKSAKTYLGEEDLRGLDWSKRNSLGREAILVAVSALED
jgi:hypothetical protein